MLVNYCRIILSTQIQVADSEVDLLLFFSCPYEKKPTIQEMANFFLIIINFTAYVTGADWIAFNHN